MTREGAETELSRLFRLYSHIMIPVREENGEITGASFIHEQGTIVSAAKGSSNIGQHLSDYYFIMLSDEDKAKRRPRTKQPRLDEVHHERCSLRNLLVDAPSIVAKGCAMGALPLSMLDNPGFRYILSKLCPSLEFPSRRTVTRHVDQLFDTVTSSMKSVIKDCRHSSYGNVMVSMCCDMWTSKSKRGHLGINVTVIDDGFTMRTFPISCIPLDHPHNSERIAATLLSELSSVDIESTDLIAVTTDNEANFVLAGMMIRGQMTSKIACACHGLNLCGRKAADDAGFSLALNALIDMVNYFSSPKRLECLKKKHPSCRNFISIAQTRWNFISDVVSRSIDNAPMIASLTPDDLTLLKTDDIEYFTKIQKSFADAVCCLSPLRGLLTKNSDSIRVLSSTSKVTASKIFTITLDLWNQAHELSLNETISGVAQSFARRMSEEIDNRFYFVETPKSLTCAEWLDPQVAHTKMSTVDGTKIEEMKEIRDLLADAFFPLETAAAQQEVDIFGDITDSTEKSNNYLFKRQMGKYLEAAKRDHDIMDGLEWWKANRENFPLVSYVARSILSAQASSAETERLFSVGGFVVNKYRTTLTGERAAKLIVLSKYLRNECPQIDDDGTIAEDLIDILEDP